MGKLNYRQIHLDFHNSPFIKDIGKDFDPEEFVNTLKKANVNSITCFAKCHHGMSYYPTKVGKMHPHLKFDLLGEMIRVCHKKGIKVPVYISVCFDEYSVENHPEWRQIIPEGKLAGAGPLSPGWKVLCLNTPYVDYLFSQTEEVLKNYEVDGLFFDIVKMVPPGCVCKFCMKEMEKEGINPEDTEQLERFKLKTEQKFMEKMSNFVREINPEINIFFNSRLRLNMREEIKYYTHFEIESLPSGGWGYNHFPLMAKYFQTFEKEFLGMTARFHKGWADFGSIKNQVALEYEVFVMLANGGKCSIGDQLHPRGKLEKSVYEAIGKVYGKVKEIENWCEEAKPVVEIGVLIPDGEIESLEGAMRILLETHHQFQIIDKESDFSNYKLLILPDNVNVSGNLKEKINKFIENGGKLLLNYHSGILPENFLSQFGIEYLSKSNFNPDYYKLLSPLNSGIPDLIYVFYEPGTFIKVKENFNILAKIYKPYFNRSYRHFSSHFQTPPSEETEYPGIVCNGNIAYISTPVFRLYMLYGNRIYREIVKKLIEILLPDGICKTNLPNQAQIHILRKEDYYLIHILYYPIQRLTKSIDIIDDLIPLNNIEVEMKSEFEVSSVILIPQNEELKFEKKDEKVKFVIPEIKGHQAIIVKMGNFRSNCGVEENRQIK